MGSRYRAATLQIPSSREAGVPRVLGTCRRPRLIVIAGTHVGDVHELRNPRTVLGRSASADIRILEDGVSREHVEFVLAGDKVAIRDLGSRNGTFLNGVRVNERELVDGDKIAVGGTVIVKFAYEDELDESYHEQLLQSAIRDGLTGALKREFFVDRVEGEVAFSVRHESPLALVMWDLDRFKGINDRHGHAAGDQVLSASARAAVATIRREDLFARLGGEEFVIACRATDAERAISTAERLRAEIARAAIAVDGATVRVTASFGVAICPTHGRSVADLFAAADTALYRAKANGRNRVELASCRG